MRPIIALLALLLAGPANACDATRPAVELRDVVVEQVGPPDAPSLRVTALLETRLALPPSTTASIFGRDGRFRGGDGQSPPVQPPEADGVRRYRFGTQFAVAPALLVRLADRVLLQTEIGGQTFTVLAKPKFVGLATGPFGAMPPDACLAPVRDGPALRDAAVLTVPDLGRTRFRVQGCVAAPALPRLDTVDLTARVLLLRAPPPGGQQPRSAEAERLAEAAERPGNSHSGLQPLRHAWHRMPAYVAILRGDTNPLDEPPAALYPLAAGELTTITCREPTGPACTAVTAKRYLGMPAAPR